ncbi:MAG: alpha/beta hydrolase [Ilumatobacteraceae bacterium]|nr:alpha/beta hydrolase [Ilumatobacteraceae bacterium]
MAREQHHRLDTTPLFSVESGPEAELLVVLIHGSLDRSGGMALVARHIQGSHRVLRYDRRGYGRSWPHAGPFAVDNQVDDLSTLIGDRKVVLIGHSFGGNIALAASVRLHEQVVGVSTYETPLSWMDWWPGTTAGAMAVASSESDAAENFMVRLIGRKRWKELPERTRGDRRREGAALIGELTALRMKAPWSVEDISCPVLCGYGSNGAKHHAEGARWLANNVKNGCLVELSDAAHSAPMTHSLQFVTELVLPHCEG